MKGGERAAARLGDAQPKAISTAVRNTPPPTPVNPETKPASGPDGNGREKVNVAFFGGIGRALDHHQHGSGDQQQAGQDEIRLSVRDGRPLRGNEGDAVNHSPGRCAAAARPTQRPESSRTPEPCPGGICLELRDLGRRRLLAGPDPENLPG